MILLHSNSIENIVRCMDKNVWQMSQYPIKLKESDAVFINMLGTPQVNYLGVCKKVTLEPLQSWPGKIMDEDEMLAEYKDAVPTIHIKMCTPEDFGHYVAPYNYRKDG